MTLPEALGLALWLLTLPLLTRTAHSVCTLRIRELETTNELGKILRLRINMIDDMLVSLSKGVVNCAVLAVAVVALAMATRV